MKSSVLKKKDLDKNWNLIDASNAVVGRLAVLIANTLRGKNKTTFSPHLPVGDGVIVINSNKIKFTGNKHTDKVYYKHTGYPGGLKETNPDNLVKKNKSDEILKKAVKGMMPNSPHFRDLIKNNLKIYKEDSHPHESQNPTKIALDTFNKKNVRHG